MPPKSASHTAISTSDLAGEVVSLLAALGVSRPTYMEGTLVVRAPITGGTIGRVIEIGAGEAASLIEKADATFLAWRLVPAPKRGELVRLRTCAPTRRRWAAWSLSRSARSFPKALERFRR